VAAIGKSSHTSRAETSRIPVIFRGCHGKA